MSIAHDLTGIDLGPAIARMHAKTVRGSGCWLYTGYRSQRGYGLVSYRVPGRKHSRCIGAHRLALIASGVDVPRDLEACHRCHNPSCVNPGHLYVGTHSQNLQDTVDAGRIDIRSGERHPNAKLTSADVAAIRARRAAGETLRSIGLSFGVHLSTVAYVASRRLWKGAA